MGKTSKTTAESTKETKKIVTGVALKLFEKLNSAHVSGLSSSDLIGIVQNTQSLKKICDEFNLLKNTVLIKSRDEKWDSMVSLQKSINTVDESTKNSVEQYFNEYNKKCMEALDGPFNETHEIPWKGISESGLSILASTNNWTVSDLILFNS